MGFNSAFKGLMLINLGDRIFCEHCPGSDYPCVLGAKVIVKVTLEQATKTQRGSRGITLLFL